MLDIYNQFKDFKSFEVVFNNSTSELQKLFCTVKSIENNRIVINANNQQNKNIFANVGDDLTLHIYTENGIYSADSKVLLVSKGMINTEYIISYPANSKHSQRREYFRADMAIDFKMNVYANIGPDSSDNQIIMVVDSKTRNICGKGMSFIFDRPFPELSMIEIDLYFKEKTVSVSANLVYSKQIVVNSRPKYIHAFTFMDISRQDIDFIVKKCFLHQLDLRKKLI